MELIGVVIVGLLGACVGLLVGLFLQGAKHKQLAEQVIAQRATARTLAEQAGQQRGAALELLEKQHAELRGHLMTMTAELAERMQLVGSALAVALREANAEHRNDLRLAIGLPRTSTPGEEPPATRRPPEAKPTHASKPIVASGKAATTTRPSTPAPRPAPLPKPTPPPPRVTAAPIAPASSRPTPTSGAAPTSHAARPKSSNEPTPPSGWTLEQVRTHTATAEERRS